ncbi:MAG: hypothetical protein AAGJ35_12950 [Myxococcota bacterium]
MEDAERIQLKGDAIDLQILTGVVVDELGIVMQSKGTSMGMHFFLKLRKCQHIRNSAFFIRPRLR